MSLLRTKDNKQELIMFDLYVCLIVVRNICHEIVCFRITKKHSFKNLKESSIIYFFNKLIYNCKIC